MKIAFDVGGVLSKYPDVFRELLDVFAAIAPFKPSLEVWIISDMHPVEKVIDWLRRNDMRFLDHRVRSADYKTHGENCKAVLCEELDIDILIDDHMGYLSQVGSPRVRLFVMPDPSRAYYDDSWKTDGSEGDFGRRRNPPGSKRPPEDRS